LLKKIQQPDLKVVYKNLNENSKLFSKKLNEIFDNKVKSIFEKLKGLTDRI